MSHTVEKEVLTYHTESPSEGEPLFVNEELTQFDADDTEAGLAIGKLLCFFFLYTIIGMSIVGYWTWTSVAAR